MQQSSRAHSVPAQAFGRDGYVRLAANAGSRDWAEAAWARAQERMADPAVRAAWLRCEGTWFAGVDLLDNAPNGSVQGVPFAGPVPDLVAALGLTPAVWHAAQVSVTYPGYPRPKEGESAGAARYRMTRDAAHVDGLLLEGPARRRILREPHAFILGIALTENDPDAAPLVVWPESHRTMGAAFAAAQTEASSDTCAFDLTDAYTSARRAVFDRHTRRPVPLARGAAILLHRHMLHGIAPWRAPPASEGRAIAYFRPHLDSLAAWF